MSEFLNAMKSDFNYGYTENGGIKHNSTLNSVLDMFAMGGAMRNRPDEDVIRMFKKAYEEDATLALKCLFYLRDCRGGQGQRRFFRICFKWLADHHRAEVLYLIPFVATYGRYDDLYTLFGTACQTDMLNYLEQVIKQNEDHLVYKWLPSINTSSHETQKRGRIIATWLGMTERQYRKMLSEGRKACKLVETLMSQQRWNEIEFNKLPSRAGLLYKNAFMRREETRERYAAFMDNKETKVNAGVLNPVDIAHQIFHSYSPSKTERQAWDKYWECLPDYYNGREEPGIAVVDVSGSMAGTPMEAAVSLGAYIAERGHGPFKNHFITFSGNPELIEFSGIDLYDKFDRASRADWGGNTNIEAVFDLLLNTAITHHIAADSLPKTLYIFSDMEFDRCISTGPVSHDLWTRSGSVIRDEHQLMTVIEAQARKWARKGYELPRVIFWNLDARQENIPALGGRFSYVSGFSPVMISTILGGKDGWDLCLEKLNSDRYSVIASVLV